MGKKTAEEKPLELHGLTTDEVWQISERESVIKIVEYLQGQDVDPTVVKTALQQEGKKIARDGTRLHENVMKINAIRFVCRNNPERFAQVVTPIITELKALPPASVG